MLSVVACKGEQTLDVPQDRYRFDFKSSAATDTGVVGTFTAEEIKNLEADTAKVKQIQIMLI